MPEMEKEKSQELYEKSREVPPGGFSPTSPSSNTGIQTGEYIAAAEPAVPTGRVSIVVKNSRNPLALANGTLYLFVFDEGESFPVITDKGITYASTELPEGDHSFTIKVYGWNDHNMQSAPLMTSDAWYVNVRAGREAVVTVNRPAVFSTLVADISYS